jgi:hypothetical protein
MSESAMARHPRRRPGVEVHYTDHETLLLTREANRPLVLNDTALALWELCDGSTSVDEMVAAIDLLYDTETAIIRRDVETMLRQFATLKLVEWES